MAKIPRGEHRPWEDTSLPVRLGFDPSLSFWHGVTSGLWNKLDGVTGAGLYRMEYIGFEIDREPDDAPPFPRVLATIGDDRRVLLRLIWLAVGPQRGPIFPGTPGVMRVEGRFHSSGQKTINILDIGDAARAGDWNRILTDARLAYSIVHGVVTSGAGAPSGPRVPITADDLIEAYCTLTYDDDGRPSVRDLADHYHVSTSTIKRRIKDLRAAGESWPPLCNF